MIHFGHGELAHGVFCVFWVAAREVNILDVAHVEEKGPQVGGEADRALGRGPLLCEECDAMKVLLILDARELVREGSRR